MSEGVVWWVGSSVLGGLSSFLRGQTADLKGRLTFYCERKNDGVCVSCLQLTPADSSSLSDYSSEPALYF